MHKLSPILGTVVGAVAALAVSSLSAQADNIVSTIVNAPLTASGTVCHTRSWGVCVSMSAGRSRTFWRT
jgi:hypothetical protein